MEACFDFNIGLHISFSPNGCLAVALNGDWEFHLRYMEHSISAEDEQHDSSKSTGFQLTSSSKLTHLEINTQQW